MGRGMRFLETSATPEEDSYGYRVEWDDQTTSVREMVEQSSIMVLVQEMFRFP